MPPFLVPLLADSSRSFPDLALPEIGNLTATAILGWYAWHTATRTLPALVTAFREEMAAARSAAHAERDAFRLELAAERQQRHDDAREIVAAVHQVAARLPAAAPEPRPRPAPNV